MHGTLNRRSCCLLWVQIFFLIKFSTKEDKYAIVDMGLWSFDKMLFTMHDFALMYSPKDYNFPLNTVLGLYLQCALGMDEQECCAKVR